MAALPGSDILLGGKPFMFARKNLTGGNPAWNRRATPSQEAPLGEVALLYLPGKEGMGDGIWQDQNRYAYGQNTDGRFSMGLTLGPLINSISLTNATQSVHDIIYDPSANRLIVLCGRYVKQINLSDNSVSTAQDLNSLTAGMLSTGSGDIFENRIYVPTVTAGAYDEAVYYNGGQASPYTAVPTANGNYTAWTAVPSGSALYTLIDDPYGTHDDLATYIQSSTAPQRASFTFATPSPDLSLPISSVKLTVWARSTPSTATVAFDAVSTTTGTATTSTTHTHTPVGTPSTALIFVTVQDGFVVPTSITYGGTGSTKQTGQQDGAITSRSWFYLLASPAAGAQSVVVTFAANQTFAVTVITLTGGHATAPLVETNGMRSVSTAPFAGTGSDSTDLIIDVMGAYTTATATVGAAQTQRANQTVGNLRQAVSTQAGSDGSAMTWTLGSSAAWSETAIRIKGASNSAGSFTIFHRQSATDTDNGTNQATTDIWTGYSPAGWSYTLNPRTSAAWAVADFAGMEWGVKLISGNVQITAGPQLEATHAGGTWAQYTNLKATHFKTHEDRFVRGVPGAADIGISWAFADPRTEANWNQGTSINEPKVPVGDLNVPITGLQGFRDIMYVDKEDGTYAVDKDEKAPKILSFYRSAANGINPIEWGGTFLVVSAASGTFVYDPGGAFTPPNAHEIGTDEYPYNNTPVRGIETAHETVGKFLYSAILSDTGDTYITVAKERRQLRSEDDVPVIHHTIAYLPGLDCRAMRVVPTATNPRLYFGAGANVRWKDLTPDGGPPGGWVDSEGAPAYPYAASGTHYWGRRALPWNAVLRKIEGQYRGMSSTETIQWQAKVDDGSWANVGGAVTGNGLQNAFFSSQTAFAFELNAGLARGSNNKLSPILEWAKVYVQPRPETSGIITAYLHCANGMVDRNGNVIRETEAEMVSNLRAWRETVAPITLVDWTGASVTVIITDLIEADIPSTDLKHPETLAKVDLAILEFA